MSTAHLFSCIGSGQFLPFHDAFAAMQKSIEIERISYIYHCGRAGIPLADVLTLAS